MHIDLKYPDQFRSRHIGPSEDETQAMLQAVGVNTLDQLIDEAVPSAIRVQESWNLPEPYSEAEMLAHMKQIAQKNKVYKSYIGQGYYNTYTPAVIQRNILENPGWYTQYTPYQSEIAQGRLEALINFQTMVTDLTGMEIANASLLDEATAAAEAMAMAQAVGKRRKLGNAFVVDAGIHPQTLAVLETRAEPLGIQLIVSDLSEIELNAEEHFGVLMQYPDTFGAINDPEPVVQSAKAQNIVSVFASDLLALTQLKEPGQFDADIVVGSAQRFGVPMGYGGPHAAFFATREDFKRNVPGRMAGVSIDDQGHNAYRLALQTREQHIRREKATSNICTAQVLLAIINAMYAVYHGPEQLDRIAKRTHGMTQLLDKGLQAMGYKQINTHYFDTLHVELADSTGETLNKIKQTSEHAGMNFRYFDDLSSIGISLDETVGLEEVRAILEVFSKSSSENGIDQLDLKAMSQDLEAAWPTKLQRETAYLTHPVFNSYRSETEMLRYIKQLENKDLSLTHSMIPLGSCTMKLNATSELLPISMPEFMGLHPYCPRDQAQGYEQLFRELSDAIADFTGFDSVSLMPNSGAQGEYTGLMVIREYLKHNGGNHRNVALVPSSAHGTNPASAVMAGMKVVIVNCDDQGNIDYEDLKTKVEKHSEQLAALMITYPSTHGVFETHIQDICRLIHDHGGQVYMDGANLQAQVGITHPAAIGADVCHLNLHKTFCIPHGGGGPGMGPIAMAKHLTPHMPQSPLYRDRDSEGMGPVAAAPFGSASILSISHAYIYMMGEEGLRQATKYAILNANYIKSRLEGHYDVLYQGEGGRIAHELILDVRGFKQEADVDVGDVAKRLMDYGFHAPTVSWPVPGTLMVEPTESESQEELDRFCDALIAIRQEIREIAEGKADQEDNLLKNAPHTAQKVMADDWQHPYSRKRAAFPLPWLNDHKFWPAVGRINDSYGDRNLMCTCPPMSDYEDTPSQAKEQAVTT